MFTNILTDFFGFSRKSDKDAVKCRKCKSVYSVWFPTPRTGDLKEILKVKKFAMCEYCLFKVK